MARATKLSVTDGLMTTRQVLNDNPELAYFHLDHRAVAETNESFIAAAYREASLRPLLFELANKGFMAYVLRDGVTSFVHHREIRALWVPVKEGRYSVDENDVVYTYSPPTIVSDEAAAAMVVVFSSISPNSHNASLSRHFTQNFASLQKYVSPSCSILRIADLGGVTGSYYMNTFAQPKNEEHVQGLIRRIAAANGISPDRVYLYGTSKGGTGALLHGLIGGYRVVAVDPIVCDRHYVKKYRDLHLVNGLFPASKPDRFASLFSELSQEDSARIHIITSRRSPQFDVMQNVLGEDWVRKAAVFDVGNPDIEDHPDVGPRTVHLVLMLLNMMASGMTTQTGLRPVI